MRCRSLMSVAAIVLLISAATTIDTQHVVWNPPWPARLGIGGGGVFLAFGALLIGRAARCTSEGNKT